MEAGKGTRHQYGRPYRKGERVFFYPRTGMTYAGGSAARASAQFDELANLEG